MSEERRGFENVYTLIFCISIVYNNKYYCKRQGIEKKGTNDYNCP